MQNHKHLKFKSHEEMKEFGIQPIIVIIEEVESISIEVLQDLLLISSEYQTSIPFVFVFGVSTSPSYIHRHISQQASSFITMETFQAQPSSLLLSEIIDKLLMSSSTPFRLGGKVFKLLLDIFLFHDLSVQNFISSLEFCMLEHFLRGEAAFLCCLKDDRTNIFKNISSTSVSTLRNVPSFRKYQETLSQDEVNKLKDDSYFCKRVQQFLLELEDWYITFCTLIKALHCLVASLPGNPLGRQVRELFSLCLSQQITEAEEFQSAWKLFSMSSKVELTSKLEEVKNILEESDRNADLDTLLDKLDIFYGKLSKDEEIKVVQTEKSPSRVIDLKPGDRFYLREKLLGHQNSKYPKSAFEELRKEILTCFEHVFISHLKPYQNKPFHEVFFFDAIGSVKYQLLGSVRATVQTGLTNPHKYLQCECCKLNEKDLLVTSFPDVSLCYKLHLECGKFINLYDWLQAFIAVVTGEDETTGSKKNKKKVDERLQARFIQAVAELQLLGFIKPTKRKTDHVQRLTWGGC